MIIRGLDNIVAHMYAEHQKNLDAWFKRNNVSPVMERAVRSEYSRRNIEPPPEREVCKNYDCTNGWGCTGCTNEDTRWANYM